LIASRCARGVCNPIFAAPTCRPDCHTQQAQLFSGAEGSSICKLTLFPPVILVAQAMGLIRCASRTRFDSGPGRFRKPGAILQRSDRIHRSTRERRLRRNGHFSRGACVAESSGEGSYMQQLLTNRQHRRLIMPLFHHKRVPLLSRSDGFRRRHAGRCCARVWRPARTLRRARRATHRYAVSATSPPSPKVFGAGAGLEPENLRRKNLVNLGAKPAAATPGIPNPQSKIVH
jgi:hypothetical protein